MVLSFLRMIPGVFGKSADEEGQGLVEYALIIVLVAIFLVAALQTLGTDIGSVFSNISTTLETALSGGGGS